MVSESALARVLWRCLQLQRLTGGSDSPGHPRTQLLMRDIPTLILSTMARWKQTWLFRKTTLTRLPSTEIASASSPSFHVYARISDSWKEGLRPNARRLGARLGLWDIFRPAL